MLKSLSKLFMVVGAVALAGSLLWWHAFFSEVMEFLGASGGLPLECVYTIGGPCRLVAGAATALGASAYDPRLFWAGVGLLLVGVVLAVIPEKDDDNGFGPTVRRDRDPRL